MIKSKSGHLLVVDDEVELLTPLCNLLSEWGYEVSAYTSGKGALEALKEQYFDLLLADLKMPEMDGIELLKAALEIDPNLVGIIITGKGTIQSAVEAMKIGAFDYVLKPPEFKMLQPILSRAMEIRGLRESEKTLKQASKEWRVTFDSMPYGVVLLDVNFNILKANNYISRLSGIPLKDMIGQKCYELIHGTDNPIENCPYIRSGKTLRTETLEFYEPRVNKYLKGYTTPICDEKGLISAYVHSLVDITEVKEKEKKISETRDAFFNMLKDLDFSYKELRELYQGLIHSFVSAIDAKSPWTKGHSERVTNYAIAIAKEIGLKEKDIETLHTAALLHDIGKIGTYDVILDKPGRLTHEEFELVKTHPAKGEEILKPITQLKKILPIIRHHHERIDGKGYPDGLKGEEIPLCARILYVADSFDAMTADRPYRPAPGLEYAISELKKYSGVQFDPKVVETFLKVLGKPQE
jgi:putative nucleotidyltransferase with HDIG domain/PAS domain S-box-containing protein